MGALDPQANIWVRSQTQGSLYYKSSLTQALFSLTLADAHDGSRSQFNYTII